MKVKMQWILAAYTKSYEPVIHYGPFDSDEEAREYADEELKNQYVAIYRLYEAKK